MRSTLFLFLGTLFGALLSACNGSGGGSGNGGGGSPGAIVGSRAVPGYSLDATLLTTAEPGQTATLRVRVRPESGQSSVQSVSGWIAAGYTDHPSPVGATRQHGESDTWHLEVLVPTPLPDNATVWLRLINSDGAVMEVGRDGFELARLSTH